MENEKIVSSMNPIRDGGAGAEGLSAGKADGGGRTDRANGGEKEEGQDSGHGMEDGGEAEPSEKACESPDDGDHSGGMVTEESGRAK